MVFTVPPLTDTGRAADATVRGFLSQAYWSVDRWLSLEPAEVLLFEGREDIDRYFVDPDGAIIAVHEQIKDLSGRISARSDDVYKTIFNFLCSFHEYHSQGRRCFLVFTTSAEMARQRVAKPASDSAPETEGARLTIDVLRTWHGFGDSTASETQAEELARSIKELVREYALTPSQLQEGTAEKSKTKGIPPADQLQAAIDYLDAEPGRWSAFLRSVSWNFAQESGLALERRLRERVEKDDRTKHLPADLLAYRLVVEVLRASSRATPEQRAVTATRLIEIAGTTEEELKQWAERARAPRLSEWLSALDERVATLEAKSSRHEERFASVERSISPIERLRRLSKSARRTLARFATLRIQDREIPIERGVVNAMLKMAREQSFLVVGEPGAGKSGALYNLIERLEREEREVLCLMAEALPGPELGASLLDVLESWSGDQTIFLVIDALDSVRGDAEISRLRRSLEDLVHANARVRVIASIRTFDLYARSSIARLFEGEPHGELSDRKFPSTRHIYVAPLTNDEIAPLKEAIPTLYALFEGAPASLQELLRVPFNLSLVARLLDRGITPLEIGAVRTHVELMDLYWKHRVEEPSERWSERKAALEEVCDQMVRSRSLQIPEHRLSRSVRLQTGLLHGLLSEQVLVRPQWTPDAQPDDDLLAFAHHILFDYAVARHWLKSTADEFARQLLDDPDLVLVTRPSLEMYFQRLWTKDSTRTQFWHVTLRLAAAAAVREIAKIIGPSVAVKSARSFKDLAPLTAELSSSEEGTRAAAELVLHHMIGALQATAAAELPRAGADAGPFSELAEQVSGSSQWAQREAARRLLTEVCAVPEALTSDQLGFAGRAARNLFASAWSDVPPNQWLMGATVDLVCRTFASDAAASALLLRSVIEPASLKEHGFAVLRRLASQVHRLMPIDPKLVAEIYTRAFQNVDDSTETTNLGSGAVMGITSNRRQDYEGALYTLAHKQFPQFLAASLDWATRALISTLEAYVARRHGASFRRLREEEKSFSIGQEVAHLYPDGSAVWSTAKHYKREDEGKMLDIWEKYLAELADRPGGTAALGELLTLVARENRLAVVWGRLLRVGSRRPESAGRVLRPLLWSAPLLEAFDTSYWAGQYLKAAYRHFDTSEREQVERAILDIPAAFGASHPQAAEATRNRLLGCLEFDALVSPEAKGITVELRAKGKVFPNEPPIQFTSSSRRLTRQDHLEDLERAGVPVQAEPNRRIQALLEPIEAFADSSNNAPLLTESLVEILPALNALHGALEKANAEGVHPVQRNEAWSYLAAACEKIAVSDLITVDEAVATRIRAYLLAAASCASPEHRPELDAQFDATPSWGYPSARVAAAVGLSAMAWHSSLVNEDVLDALERLGLEDPVPAVRYQVARRLTSLYKNAPDRMWRLIDHYVHKEPSKSVAHAAMVNFERLGSVLPDRVVELLKTILGRFGDEKEGGEFRRDGIGLITDMYVQLDQSLARDYVFDLAVRPQSNDASWLPIHVQTELTRGPVSPANPKEDAARQRAWSLLERLTHSAVQGSESLFRKRGHDDAASSNEVRQRAQRFVELLDSIGIALYHASGAFEEKQAEEKSSSRERLPVEKRRRFYSEAQRALGALTPVPLPGLSHHLLEMLEYSIQFDPAGVFVHIGTIVNAAKDGGYQYDSLAVDLVVRLITRYLADHRDVLQDNENCRRILLDVLDVFVRAGWPEAWNLTYRLHDIFR